MLHWNRPEGAGQCAQDGDSMSPIRTILVPVDFSPHSSEALDFAISLAKEVGAGIHLLHCYQINPGGVSPYGIVLPENLDRDLREGALRSVAEWAEKVSAEGLGVKHSVTPEFPSEAIVATAEEIGADLIVMGTRGNTGLKHVLLGSVAERTIRMAPCPVTTVKAPEST
jgi:nucleotide-binding universal stress UspA family protein